MFAVLGYQTCNNCGSRVRQPLQDEKHLTVVEEMSVAGKKKNTSYFDCSSCGAALEKLTMAHFSFNALKGACGSCKGMGECIGVDLSKLLNEEKTLKDGGVAAWDVSTATHYESVITAASRYYKFDFNPELPIKDYSEQLKDFLLYGVEYPAFINAYKGMKQPAKASDGNFRGLIPGLLERYKKDPTNVSADVKKYIVLKLCDLCGGVGLGRLGCGVVIGGKTISQVSHLNLSELFVWVQSLNDLLLEEEKTFFAAFYGVLIDRISNLIEVGLGYLSLDRSLPSLSGGESQRVRLANVLGSGLTDVLYVLDEPTTGLHPRDTEKLLNMLRKIQENGNTVLVIEHDPEIISNADYILEIGPGGGSCGGEVIASGSLMDVAANPDSLIRPYLINKRVLAITSSSKVGRCLTVRGAHEHNLKNTDVSIPVQQFVVLTGVSGSGKSTFLFGILDKIMRRHLNHADIEPGKYESVEGLEYFNRVVTVTQRTIGNTQSSRSNVATYTKLFDLIRDLFASLPESKEKGFGPDSFSFNSSSERCENCNGAGVVEVDMAFMAPIEMVCPECNGARFNDALLQIKFLGHSISGILDLTVSDAVLLFKQHAKIVAILNLMQQVGLGYLKLGQSTIALSGGEAQRIRLAAELVKSGVGGTLYLLDEPTTGLHPREVDQLIVLLKNLVAKGNTVVVIEHNLDVICGADWLIDFGPNGGSDGGMIVASGSLKAIMENVNSLTGRFLQTYFMK